MHGYIFLTFYSYKMNVSYYITLYYQISAKDLFADFPYFFATPQLIFPTSLESEPQEFLNIFHLIVCNPSSPPPPLPPPHSFGISFSHSFHLHLHLFVACLSACLVSGSGSWLCLRVRLFLIAWKSVSIHVCMHQYLSCVCVCVYASVCVHAMLQHCAELKM